MAVWGNPMGFRAKNTDIRKKPIEIQAKETLKGGPS